MEEDQRQELVDRVCYYRNLAIILGAKPDQMMSKYDRWLCDRGIKPDESMVSAGMNMVEQIGELHSLWDEIDSLQLEVQHLRRGQEDGPDS